MTEVKDPSDGGRKNDKSKESFDLMPVMPLMELAQLFTLGQMKYGRRNWESGIKFGRLYAAMIRHAMKFWAGEEYDQVDGQHHLTAVAWNALCLREMQRIHPELDDRLPHNLPMRQVEDMNVEDLEKMKEKIEKTIETKRKMSK